MPRCSNRWRSAAPGAIKYFLWSEIEELKNNKRWMAKATEFVRLKIKDKNEQAAQNLPGAQRRCAKTNKQAVGNGNRPCLNPAACRALPFYGARVAVKVLLAVLWRLHL